MIFKNSIAFCIATVTLTVPSRLQLLPTRVVGGVDADVASASLRATRPDYR